MQDPKNAPLRFLGPSLPQIPVSARHAEYSVICSLDDEPWGPSDRLLDLSVAAVQLARNASMKHIRERMNRPPFYADVWPGEHYKLLDGLVRSIKPKTVVEIGTFTGMSSLAMLPALPDGSALHTFDVFPWQQIPGTLLRDSDFADGRLKAIVGDLSLAPTMSSHADLFRAADLIFVDGPKDRRFEIAFIQRLDELNLVQRPVLMFDDIRVWNMIDIWRLVRRPKMDLTSFGHWSGTGLVDWR